MNFWASSLRRIAVLEPKLMPHETFMPTLESPAPPRRATPHANDTGEAVGILAEKGPRRQESEKGPPPVLAPFRAPTDARRAQAFDLRRRENRFGSAGRGATTGATPGPRERVPWSRTLAGGAFVLGTEADPRRVSAPRSSAFLAARAHPRRPLASREGEPA